MSTLNDWSKEAAYTMGRRPWLIGITLALFTAGLSMVLPVFASFKLATIETNTKLSAKLDEMCKESFSGDDATPEHAFLAGLNSRHYARDEANTRSYNNMYQQLRFRLIS